MWARSVVPGFAALMLLGDWAFAQSTDAPTSSSDEKKPAATAPDSAPNPKAEEKKAEPVAQDAAAASDTPPAASDGKGEPGSRFPIHGFLSTKYRFRTNGDEHDNDLYETFSIDLGDPERHRVTAHLLARATADLDQGQDARGFYVYDSITDSYDSSINARLYYAYLDVHRLGKVERIRVGRQSIYDTPEVAYLDGARVETEDLGKIGLRLGAYGGIPVHPFEASASGDAIGGAFAQIRPWQGGRFRGDWMHLEDRRYYGKQRNELWGFAGWQSVTEWLAAHARVTGIDSRARDILVQGTVQKPEWDFTLQASFYRLLETQRSLALEVDPLFVASFEYFPYWQTQVVASKGLGEHFVLDGGFDVRRLIDRDNERVFNREFGRFFLTPTVRGWPHKKVSFSVTGEVWDSSGEDVSSIGGDVMYEVCKALRATLGTSFALYRFDFYANRERDRVRTSYVKLRCQPSKHWRFDLNYEYVSDAFDDDHQVWAGVTWSF